MSDTPRMDASAYEDDGAIWQTGCDIERELNAANQIAKKYEDRYFAANDRIKRLEEALEGTVKWIVDLANSGDAGFWNPEEQSAIIAARAALKKEDKL
jgi:hypothetical protein